MNLCVNLQVMVDADDAAAIDDVNLAVLFLPVTLHSVNFPIVILEMDPILQEDFHYQWDQCKVHLTNQQSCYIQTDSVQ